MTIQTKIGPDGQKLVTMTAEEYEDLIDARDAEAAMREIAAGTMPMVPNDAVDAYLAAPTPLAFWRGHRGLTQVELAESAGISQAYLSQLENGEREAVASVYRRLAERLRVRIGDLLD
jgi:DNA-binding Xre family transcriptional regulator